MVCNSNQFNLIRLETNTTALVAVVSVRNDYCVRVNIPV